MPKKSKQAQPQSMTSPTSVSSSASASLPSSSSSLSSSSNAVSQSQQRLQLRRALCATLLSLPEVLETTLQFLSKPKLLEVSCVNRQWHACANFILLRDHYLRWRPTLDERMNEQLMLKVAEGKVQAIEIDFQNSRPDFYFEADLIAPWDTYDATFPTQNAAEEELQTPHDSGDAHGREVDVVLPEEDEDEEDEYDDFERLEFDIYDRIVDRSMLEYIAEWIRMLAGGVLAGRLFCLPNFPDELEPEYAHLFDNAEIRKSPVKRLKLLRNRYWSELNVVRALSYFVPQLTSLEMTFSDETNIYLDLPGLFKAQPNLEHLLVAFTDENHQVLNKTWYLSTESGDEWHAEPPEFDEEGEEMLASTIVYPKIKSLHFYHVEARDRFIHKLFSQLPNLQELTYTGSLESLEPSIYKILPEKIPHLRELTFLSHSEPDLQEMLTHYPRLDTLRLCKGSVISASTIQKLQHHCLHLTTLDLTDATIQYVGPFSQALLSLLRSPTQRLKHLLAPKAVFLLEDIVGKQNQWHTGNLRTLVVRFDCTQERAPIHRIQYRPTPSSAPSTFTHPPLSPKLNHPIRQRGYSDPSSCSCITPQNNNSNNNNAADTHLHQALTKPIDPSSSHTLSSTPPPYRCEHSRTVFQFLAKNCPLLQSLRLQIHPQICMGSHGLGHLRVLQDLTAIHLVVTHFDRVKRRDLEWMMPSSSTSASASASSSPVPQSPSQTKNWPELNKVTIAVTRSIYHDCHLDAKRWILEMMPNVAFDIDLNREAHV
ncbi:hypothetical protein BGZ72_010877 [Mortierella alpina]|nr:hypothetical protein BGZ72_010877 [Mortierella alpina]